MVVEMLSGHTIVALIVSILSLIVGWSFIKSFPRQFRRNFGPALYLMPLMSAWGAFMFLNYLYLVSPTFFSIAFGLLALIPFIIVCAFSFKLIASTLAWTRQRAHQLRVELNPLRAVDNVFNAMQADNINFIDSQPTIQQEPQINFAAAPLIQSRQGNATVWQPTPIVKIGRNAPITKDWISVKIEAPTTARQGELLAIRVDVSNAHASKTLTEQGLLEIRFPTEVNQVLGPDNIFLRSNGDTISLYYTWNVPYLSGNFLIRYHLLNLQSKTEKVLVVE